MFKVGDLVEVERFPDNYNDCGPGWNPIMKTFFKEELTITEIDEGHQSYIAIASVGDYNRWHIPFDFAILAEKKKLKLKFKV